MQDILIILLCISLGMTLGHWQRGNAPLLRLADAASLYAVHGLLFLLGIGLGSDALLVAQLPLFGGRALVISFCCTGASVLCLLPTKALFPAGPAAAAPAGARGPSPFWGSARILCSFSLGVALGVVFRAPAWISGGGPATLALFFLVFVVGAGLGADLRAFGIIRQLHLKILAVPLLIMLGTALGAVSASFLLPGLSIRDTLSVGAGFGYYSLSSILIENSGDSALASVALLANILREITAILTAPLLVRFCGSLAPVGAAGATAMDTSLPAIARFCGERVAVVAVFSGMCLTLLTPFLVTAALRL